MAKRRAVTTKKQSKSQGCLIVVVGIFGLLLLISQGLNRPNNSPSVLTQNAGAMTVTAFGSRQAQAANRAGTAEASTRVALRSATEQTTNDDTGTIIAQVTRNAATRATIQTVSPQSTGRATESPQTAEPETTIYYAAGTGNINARATASTSAAVITTFARGDEVQVIDQVQGDAVNGNRTWFRIDADGQIAYVHSSLLSQTRPSAQAQPVQQQAAPVATGVPQQPAQQQAQPTAIPQQPPTAIPQQPLSGGSGGSSERPGNCSTAVAMGLSAEQAGQWSHLDRDGDHVACYGE